MHMNKALLALATFILLNAGCVVSVGVPEPKPKPKPKRPAMDPLTASQIAEIDALGKLQFESGKLEGYQDIARRKTLTGAAQAHLAGSAAEALAFEHSLEAVLLELVRNPSLDTTGEMALLNALDSLSFEHSKERVLGALRERKRGQ